MNISANPRIIKALDAAACSQYGHATYIKEWLIEDGDHGVTYHGFDTHEERWLYVSLGVSLEWSKGYISPGA